MGTPQPPPGVAKEPQPCRPWPSRTPELGPEDVGEAHWEVGGMAATFSCSLPSPGTEMKG